MEDILQLLPQFCSHHHCWVLWVQAGLEKLWSPYQLWTGDPVPAGRAALLGWSSVPGKDAMIYIKKKKKLWNSGHEPDQYVVECSVKWTSNRKALFDLHLKQQEKRSNETYLVIRISEIADHDGYQVSGESCWEVGPVLVQEHCNVGDLLHKFRPHCGL